MASFEVPIGTVRNEDAGLPCIGVLVTADVHVTRYDSSPSVSDDDRRVRKCTIVTSLNAIIKKPTTSEVETSLIQENEPATFSGVLPTLSSEERFEHPLVRQSKKHTQLNNSNLKINVSFYKRSQIDRTVLLPYLGCTTQHESFKSYGAVFTKSSRSWEIIKKVNKFDNVKQFHSQTVVGTNPKAKTLSENLGDSRKVVCHKKNLTQEYELPNNFYTNIQQPVRNFYLVKTCSSSYISLEDEESNVKNYKNGFGRSNKKSQYMLEQQKAIYPDKQDLLRNITGFEEEISGLSPKSCSKTTRNVSILHRPKTRDKATSTTSLYKVTTVQNKDDILQELLMPYISVGGDFPSEIVLKLVPKKEALQSRIKDNPGGDVKSTNSSELNLLAPTLNSTAIKTKKKKGKGFLTSCFPFMKKEGEQNGSDIGSNTSLDSNKEVYFPSIVEVHNKKLKKSVKDNDSEIDASA